MVRVQAEDFDPALELQALIQAGGGAVASFIGVVRADGAPPVMALVLEHYPPMTQAALEALVAQAQRRWPLHAVRIIHRVGELAVGAPIVFVGVSATHRAEAFAACEFLVDFLKTQAPFWKRAVTAQGSYWIEARASDSGAAQRWAHG